MDHVQHPDQIQLNNPWPALSTQHVNPEDNNPRVEQTPTVEAAPLYGERDALSPCSQNFEQNNHIPFYAYSNLHPAHQNQEMQGDVLAWIRPNQGLAVPTFGLSDGEDLAGGANYPYGPPAVPATMVMVGRAGNEGLHMPYYHLDLQTSPQSNRLVRSERPPASSTEAGEAAFSSCLYGCCPFTSLDVSLAGPAAQAVAPQMNTVTPYVGYGNDGGGSPVGAGVCAALPAPRPTRKTMEGASRTPFTSGRSDAGRRHRSPHRALGYDQTSRRVPIRRAMRRSQSGAARGPAVQFEADVHVLATRLLKEGADHIAVKLLCDEIFNNEVSAKALMVKSMFREHSTGISMRSKYRLLLERVDGSKGYCCLLCPQSHRKEYKNPPDSIRHFCKAHFGIVLTCISGCGRPFYRQSEMNQHLKTCQANLDGRSFSDFKWQ